MSLLDLLQTSREDWTLTERRLIDFLLANPKETAFLSTNELAKRASVHPASAVRFARKLGFDGYPPLRARLQMELFGVSEAAERMKKRMAHVGRRSVLASAVEQDIAALSRLPEQVREQDLAAAARTLLRASQTFLFATGHATALAQFLEIRLGRLGCRTQMLKHVEHDTAVNLVQAQSGDAFVLFALNTVHPLVPKVLAHAREIGAHTILVSDLPGARTRPAPDISLAASRGAESEPRSLAVPMTLCNALVLHVSRAGGGATLANLKRLDRIRRKLEPS